MPYWQNQSCLTKPDLQRQVTGDPWLTRGDIIDFIPCAAQVQTHMHAHTDGACAHLCPFHIPDLIFCCFWDGKHRNSKEAFHHKWDWNKEWGTRSMWCQHITLHPPIIFLPIFLTGSSSEDITIMTIGRICVGEVLRAKQAQSLH